MAKASFVAKNNATIVIMAAIAFLIVLVIIFKMVDTLYKCIKKVQHTFLNMFHCFSCTLHHLKKMIHKTKFVSKKVKNRCYKIFISTTWATPSSSFERVT